ncbi:MAG TPA: hypothetical protein VMI35_07940 [Puia sp.]|nr:hypothetical protein [Puia sp.]
MKKTPWFLMTMICVYACDKPVPSNLPPMNYSDLTGQQISFGGRADVDLDGDSIIDVRFSTLLVGDPLAQIDKEKYFAESRGGCLLPLDTNDNAPRMNLGDRILAADFSGHSWLSAASVELVQKVKSAPGSHHWEGKWAGSNHNYLPVQVRKNGQPYNGWIELSVDSMDEKIILYRAGISKIAGREVEAGF